MDAATDRAWRWFEQELLYVRNYDLLARMQARTIVSRNPLLDRMLPGLLLLKSVALLDAALAGYMQRNLPERNAENLHAKIAVLASEGRLGSAELLHGVRRRRNAVAHEPSAVLTWPELDADVGVVRDALVELGVVQRLPQLQVGGESRRLPEDEADPDTAIHMRATIYVEEGGGRRYSEMSFDTKVGKDP